MEAEETPPLEPSLLPLSICVSRDLEIGAHGGCELAGESYLLVKHPSLLSCLMKQGRGGGNLKCCILLVFDYVLLSLSDNASG